MNVPSEHLLILAAILFVIGVLGFILRSNAIIVLASVELMLNAGNLSLLAGSRMHSGEAGLNLRGPVMAIFVILVAAAEAAVGLALVIAWYRLKKSADIDGVHELQG